MPNDSTQSCLHHEQQLRAAAEAYYNGTPTMTDAEYDALWQTHKANRKMMPTDPVWQDTILDQVGFAPDDKSGFTKVQHSTPMESLDNAFVGDDGSIKEVTDWLERVAKDIPRLARIIMEPKIDGLSLRVTYRDGKLERAVTRGNGAVGDDITANVLAAKLVPEELSEAHSGLLELNGEVFMPYDAFKALNQRLEKAGDDLAANPRNAAAGIIRRKDAEKSAGHGLKFLCHGIAAGAKMEGYDHEISRLAGLGLSFPFHDTMLASGKTSSGDLTLEYLSGICPDEYPTDGVVLKVSGLSYQDQLGSTSRAPRWAVAIKFPQPQVETTLNDITVQVGRTGVLTPVAELEPVEIDGTTVSRASLHNEDQINRLGLQIGDTVKVRKAGAIIPEVTASVSHLLRKCGGETSKEFKLPAFVGQQCPVCGHGELQLRLKAGRAVGKTGGKDTQIWACGNTAGCPAQMAGRIEYMAGRDCLDLDGLGTEACDEIGRRAKDAGIKHQFDVLDQPVEFFAALTWTTDAGGKMTFGESRAKKVMAAIERAKKLPLNRWLASLGISKVGKNTSKEITRLIRTVDGLLTAATHPKGVFYLMVNGEKADYEHLKERYAVSHHLGPVSLQNLLTFIVGEQGGYALSKIPPGVKSDNYSPDPPEEKSGPLAGKIFVVTGKLSEPRTLIQALIEQNGGTCASGISKKVNVLVAGEKAGSKLKKAEALDIPVWTEDELRKEVQ